MCKLNKQKNIQILLFTITISSLLSASASVATSPAIKIMVKEPAIYSVTYYDIISAGWDPSHIDPTKLQLINMGKDIPILFYGEEDHSFDTGDYFIFYGVPAESDLTHYYAKNKFIYENVYWLHYSESNAKRILRSQNQKINADLIEEYPKTVHLESDTKMIFEHIDWYIWETFPDYQDKGRIEPASKSFSFNLDDININKVATLRIGLRGGNESPDINPDHHVKISINDIWSDECFLDMLKPYIYEKQIPLNILTRGENNITIINVTDVTTDEDLFYLDWIEINYPRFFKAVNNELFFTAERSAAYNIKVDGFGNNSVQLFDITDQQNVLIIEGLEITGNPGDYSIAFVEQSAGKKSFIALTTDRIKKPLSVLVDEQSDLKNISNQADYVMITHEDFYDEIQRLAKHREDEGYTVNVVKIQDVYDEFNYGIMHPQAIRDFLSYTYHKWTSPAPTFVLLVGDGCSDATDRLNIGNKNFIPVKMQLFLTYAPNDSWFVEINGDDILPDMSIGRIPVKTIDQLKYVIDKIINYENNSKAEWMRNVEFIAGTHSDSFQFINEQLSSYLLFNYNAEFLSKNDFAEQDEAYLKILDKINSGRALTIYLGHSNIEQWTLLFNPSHFNDLTNNKKPTFLIALDCHNGDFSNPITEGFSEEFLRMQGGGLACFSPANTVDINEHKTLATNLLQTIFTDRNNVLGSACTIAKTKAYLSNDILDETLRQYNFLGDPATKFKICEFNLESPADTDTVFSDDPLTWVADGYNRFNIQFSPNPAFSKFPILSFYTTEPSFTPNPLLSARLRAMSRRNDTIYWRVGGLKSMDEITSFNDYFIDLLNPRFTQPWSFTVVE